MGRDKLAAIMHELSIMQSALECALERAEEAGASRILSLRLRVGVLSGVAPEALEFAFRALTPGTLAEGAELTIERVPARFWCGACDLEFQAADMFAECPTCHEFAAGLRAGQEMELASMEIAGDRDDHEVSNQKTKTNRSLNHV